MVAKALDLDLLIRDVSSRVMIAIWGGKVVSGYLNAPFGISGSAEYDSLFDTSAKLAGVNKFLKVLSGAAGVFTGKGVSNRQAKLLEETFKTWQGSTGPAFSVSLIFVALRKDDDVRDNVSKLLYAVYPSIQLATMTAPLGYTAINRDKAKGVSTVSVGKWFKASNQIITSVDFSFSQECLASGRPLYAEGTVSFEPYRMFSNDEVAQMIKG